MKANLHFQPHFWKRWSSRFSQKCNKISTSGGGGVGRSSKVWNHFTIFHCSILRILLTSDVNNKDVSCITWLWFNKCTCRRLTSFTFTFHSFCFERNEYNCLISMKLSYFFQHTHFSFIANIFLSQNAQNWALPLFSESLNGVVAKKI